jgi:hypothetical protein
MLVLPYELSVDHRRQHLRLGNRHRTAGENIAIEHDQIGELAGGQRPQPILQG